MSTLTAEMVIKAAETLQARGEKITQNSVRAELGGGSFSTISAALKQWKEEQDKQAHILQACPIPETLERRFSILNAEIWQVALAIANEQLEQERIEFKKECQEMINKSIEDMAAIKTLESELEDVEKKAEETIKRLEIHSKQLEKRNEILQNQLNEQKLLMIEEKLNAVNSLQKEFYIKLEEKDRVKEELDKRLITLQSQLKINEEHLLIAENLRNEAEKRALNLEKNLNELIEKINVTNKPTARKRTTKKTGDNH